MQSSLDLLRRHRPDYTPRSGFVWPIIDSSPPDTPPKRPNLDDMPIDDLAIDPPEKQKLHAPKKQQNNSLMIHAMRTTAMHSNITSSRSQLLDQITPSAFAATSTHPAPTPTPSQRAPTPKAPSSAPSPQDPPPVKGPAGAGKKKKKRTSFLSRVTDPLTHIIGTSVLVT